MEVSIEVHDSKTFKCADCGDQGDRIVRFNWPNAPQYAFNACAGCLAAFMVTLNRSIGPGHIDKLRGPAIRQAAERRTQEKMLEELAKEQDDEPE